MNGPHDMGAMQCYGPVVQEPNEPLFHGDWEARAMALTVAMGMTGLWNLDRSRFARESLPPLDYLSFSYYQIWIGALVVLLQDAGAVTARELEEGRVLDQPVPVKRHVVSGDVPGLLAKGGPVDRLIDAPAHFKVGDRVRTIRSNPSGHTRLPRYARDAVGVIDAVQGMHVFPDSNARGEGENPQWLYSVRFSARDLFGGDADQAHAVYVDCWEAYLNEA